MEYLNYANITATVNGKNTSNTSNTVTSTLDLGTFLIVKSQSHLILLPGQTQTYTIVLTNGFLSTATSCVFTDTIPAGMTYVASSFTFDGTTATPTISNNTLTYNFNN